MRNVLSARLLPVLLGGASVFGFAPFYFYPLPILVLAGLFWGLHGQAPREAFLRGGLFGLGWFLAGVSWVYVSLHDFGMMPAPLAGVVTLLFAAFLALFPALAVGLAARAPVDDAVRAVLVVPALWALLEWVRNWLFTGFPWQAIGYSQAPFSPLAGYAPILGVFGLSWLAAFTAAALALRRRGLLLLVAGLWAVGAGLAWVDWTRPVGVPVTVSLLQGNVAQEMKFRPEKLALTLAEYRQQILSSPARLIVTPETALPLFLEDVPEDYLAEVAGHAAENGGGLLLGVAQREPDGRYYNSMLALGGAARQSYRKAHLVPFGEFVPPGFGWIVSVLKIPLSDFARGDPTQPVLELAGQRLAVNICYEDVFGEELLHALPAATLMINASNDAWFGRSFAPWQHLQISQMRALETGRWWLRANNTGITAIVDAKGYVRARLEPFRQASLDGVVQGQHGLTPYARWGNAAFVVLMLAVLGLAWFLRRRSG
jgi:apolipoprotein N-acyltransferase